MVHLEWRKTPTETIHIDYHIPSQQMCIDCHHKKYIGDELTPIGIKPYHLNNNYNYAEGSKNQIQKWQEVGYLNPPTVTLDDPTVNYKNPAENLTKRVRSFLDINCAHCHRVDGAAELLSIKFPFHQTVNNNGLGICDDRILQGPNPGFFGQHYVLPNQPAQSLIYHKITINTPGFMMPPIGRNLIDQEASQMMHKWILSLADCP